MKKHIIILFATLMTPILGHAATTCSRANLTRCLDSACAINISSNPSARCQYCGTSDAGTATGGNGMRSVSVGTSTKYNITAKELKQAPSDPGERYAWATRLCLSRVSGCTVDDVTDTYDQLIEQSCRAAGISLQLSQTLDKIAQTKSKTSCLAKIKSCIIADDRCTSDYRQCSQNADFDKFFSGCSVDATGCDDYLSSIRSELISNRDSAISNAEALLTQIVESYKDARTRKLNTIKTGCADNSLRDACIETVCANNMNNGCAPGYEFERSIAVQLCKFYDIACATID